MSTPAPILQYTLNNKDLLPAGYTPIVYLLSDGNLWINTGVTISGNVYAQGKVVTTDTSGERDWIGNYNNSTSGGFVVGQYNSKHYVYSSNGGSTNNGTIEANVIYEHYASLTSSKGEILANGVSYTGSARNVTVTNTVTLFRRGDSNCYWKGKIYFARLWQDNTLKGDWRPCIQDSNGAIGMYDLVSRSFKANSGSGTFIAGPPLAVGKGGGKSLPEEYLQVEYLESQSSIGQRINTGLTVDSNLHISMGVTLLTGSTHITPFSSDGAWKYGYNGGVSNIYCDYNDDVVVSFNLESIRNKLVVFDLNKNVFIVNGNTIRTATASTFTTTNPITLFGTASGHKTQMKGHWCKIYNNNVLIRDLIPCYRKSDMKPGMYDTVNGVFYTNAGTGEFILGPTVCPYYSWEPNAAGKIATNPYDKDMYFEADGSRWMRIFHHNNPTGSKFASSDTFTTGVYKDANRWCAIHLVNREMGNWEFMLKQKDTSSSSEVKYRWIQYKNPFTASWNDVKPGTITNISNCSYGGLYILNSNTYFCIANSSNGNWYGALGCWTEYSGGIPGYPNTTCTSGYMDLYVRIDNNTSFNPDALYSNVSSVYDNTRGWSSWFKNKDLTGFLSIPAQPSLTNCTVAFWAKLDTNKSWLCLGSVDNSYYLGATSSGTGAFYHAKVGSSVSCYVDGSAKSAPYGDTNWHFYCFTGVDLSSWPIIYLNNYTGPNGESNDYYGWNMNGCYQNLMIFDTALTEAQVKELYGK